MKNKESQEQNITNTDKGFQIRELSKENTIFLQNLGNIHVYYEIWKVTVTIEF